MNVALERLHVEENVQTKHMLAYYDVIFICIYHKSISYSTSTHMPHTVIYVNAWGNLQHCFVRKCHPYMPPVYQHTTNQIQSNAYTQTRTYTLPFTIHYRSIDELYPWFQPYRPLIKCTSEGTQTL